MSKKLTISNIITVLRFFLLPFIVYFLIKKDRSIAFIIMLIALFSDVIDGYIARKFHQETELGKLLDPLCDKISLSAILITLLLINSIPVWAVVIIGARDFLILLGSFIIFKRRAVIFKSNIWGKITGFLFGAMILAFTLNLSQIGLVLLYISIPTMIVTFATYAQRYISVIKNMRQFRASEGNCNSRNVV